MNKNRHRIIFNAARGHRMVVAETAGSHGGAAAGEAAPGSTRSPWADAAIKRSLTALAVLLLCTPAHPQIVADPSAPGNQRPTILQTANGLPQIDIQTPSVAGVSRNTYSRFDVQSNGAILNNSRSNVSTQLGGHIAANPWLATGEARVILNEVHSSHPSHLNGYVEVAGRRAEVIIANPAGIQVNGGGFINASGVTLTTGTPVMNSGHLDAFRVQGGSVNIEGLGLDTSTADHTAILTRAMQVNAGVWAKDLTVVTGSNEVKALASGASALSTPIAGNGAAPTFMLDVGALGGMYAGKIYLVGTEAGLGVNNRGSLIAHEGTWVLKTDGSLVNSGKVQAKGDLSIRALGVISNTGDGTPASALISSQGHASIAAGATISNTVQAEIAASGTLTVNAGGALDNTTGTLAAGQSATINSAALNNDRGLIHAGAALTLTTGVTNNTAGSIGSGGALLAAVGQTNNTDGEILSAGTLDLTTWGTLTNIRGRLQAVGSSTIDTRGAQLDNTAGRIASQANLTLNTGELVNGVQAAEAGLIGSSGDLTIHAGAVTNGADGATQSNIWSAQSASIAAASFTNAGVLSGGNISLDTTADVTNAIGASMEASGDLQITTTALVNNAGQLIANQSLILIARGIGNTGTLEATHQTLEATDTFTNAAGARITASDSIAIDADTLNNRGLVIANEATVTAPPSLVHIQVSTLNNTGAGAIFGDQIAIAASTLNNRPAAGGATAPVIAARQRLDLGVQTLNNEDGALIYSGGNVAIAGSLDATLAATGLAQSINNLSAQIEAVGDLRIATGTLTNERRNIAMSQTTVVDQTSVLSMPSWWVNGQNRHDVPIEYTSNYTRHQFYLVNPANIVGDTQLVTPDGNIVRRVEVKLDPTDSVYHAANGGYAGYYGVRERITVGSAATVVLHARVRQDDVANPDQVAGAADPTAAYTNGVLAWQRNSLAYSDAYGRCTTHCTLLVVEPGYSDAQSTILRSTHRALTSTHPGLEVTRTAQQTVVEDRLNADAGAPASLRSGSNTRLDITNSLTNRYADIQAGVVLDMQAAGAVVVNEGQTLKRTHRFQNTSHTAGQGSFDWTNPDISEVIGQVGGTLSGAQQLNITAKSLTNTDLTRTTALPTSGLGFLGVSLPNATAPVTVPNSAMFQPANAGSRYLIESDPRFTDYRQWLGSDYMFAALGSDPNALQKRLGDGFYEQRLVREQVGQLTGRRFLEGHANDEAQFQALMDAGITYAQAHQLIPGVALSAQQMAQLTTDLVWLVEREVVLPDGSKTTALVPQVYVRQVPQGDFAASGALLAGNSVSLQIAEDLVNAGGRIEGGVVVAQAGRDLSNIGGLMQARSELLASAGRNVTISSPTHTTSFNGRYVDQSRTELAGVGTMRVGNTAGAQLNIEAGGNVALLGASVSNAGAGGSTVIKAAGDVQLQTVTVGSSDNTEVDARNYQRSSNGTELGTSVQGAGGISIQAGNDMVARAASVNVAEDLSVKAGNNILLEAGRAVSESASSVYTKRSGVLSKKFIEERRSSASDVALGSSLGGKNVSMQAGQDIALRGSSVVGDGSTTLGAGRDVVIEAEENQFSSSEFRETKKSGLFASGAGVTLGKQQQSRAQQFEQTTAAGSTVGAIGGDVTVIAGQNYRQSGSDLLAPGGDVTVVAKDIAITEARETSQSTTEEKFKQSGLSVSISSPVLSAVQSIASQVSAAGNTSDARMKGLAAAASAMTANNALKAIEAGKGTTIDNKANQVTSTGLDGTKTVRDANAADRLGGVDVSISLGSNKSQSTTVQSSESARGSSMVAGGAVSITARGAGADSDLLIRGSEVSAGSTATLSAEGDVALLAAQNTASLTGSNKSSSGSIGLSLGTSGMGVTVSAGGGRGKEAGDDLTHSNTRITAGDAVRMDSGGDTTLRGAVVKAPLIRAEVGGDLTIESLKDRSTYTAQQKSASASVTIGAGAGGSLSASKSGAQSDFASVTEQSGLKAGDGGFGVRVAGDTELIGGAIASNQAAVDKGLNSFSTQGLSTSDIANTAQYKASASGVSVGVGGQLGSSGMGIGSDSGSAASTTTAGISGIAGDTAVRSTDAETGIQRIFEKERVQKEVAAQVAITKAFTQQASKAVGQYSNDQLEKAKDLKRQAAQAGDAASRDALLGEALALEEAWKEGGAGRVALHMVAGALGGGVGGAAGAGLTQTAIPALGEHIAALDVPVQIKQALVQTAALALGAAAGGSTGAASALGATSQNYLSAADLRSKHQKISDCRAAGDGACEVKVLREYELKNARNTAAIDYRSILSESSLQAEKGSLERLLADPAVSEAAKAEARRSITELDKAINVIQRSPALRDAAELGLIALDVVAMGQLAVAKALTTTIVRELVLARTGKEIGEAQAYRIANNIYREDSIADPARAMSPLGDWKPAVLIGKHEADVMIAQRLPQGARVTEVIAADKVNAEVLAADVRFKPPYTPNTQIVAVQTTQPESFVRVYMEVANKSELAGSWMMRADDIAGLSREQIASKYALPQVPTHVADVSVPAGNSLRVSVANDVQIKQGLGGNGGGGGVQFEVTTAPKEIAEFRNWFSNSRPLK
ncbi:hemagglutinin repeat-containing protein [Hydrogenophaga sp.]|uniref:two-partner secretion domain-containing protein n=1 Tax=Hydrogenophaga sp. TaxID=1904254 RepID=UPI00261FCBBC|nr:hemagglutinin repeat-containing protein [Hydrogenophaga sp.]